MSRSGVARIDESTEPGARAAERLRAELIGWLTTVSPDGQPQPSPVWFWWDGEEFRIYSLESVRIENLEQNPRVSLTLDGDGTGGNVVIVEGEATIDRSRPSAAQDGEFLHKYRGRLDLYGWTPEWFAERYSVPVRVRPTRFRYW